jgi:hypothetical protein
VITSTIQWFTPKERLPEDYDDCLIVHYHDNHQLITSAAIFTLDEDGKPEWGLEVDDMIPNERVELWCALPEPLQMKHAVVETTHAEYQA